MKLRKKSQEAGPMISMPPQGLIEVFMVVAVGISFLVYGAFLVQDMRIFQVYHSKDMSMLQTFLMPIPEKLVFMYRGSPDTRFSEMEYDFDRHYSTAISTIKQGIGKDKVIEKSYIHLANPKIPEKRIVDMSKPTLIYFELDGGIEISNDLSDMEFTEPKECSGSEDFSDNVNIAYIYFVSHFNDMNIQQIYNDFKDTNTNRDKYNFDMSIPNDRKIIYIELEEKQDDTVIIFAPATKGTFGCELYNELLKNKPNVRLIKTDSLYDNTNVIYSVNIQVSSTNIDTVLDAILDITKK